MKENNQDKMYLRSILIKNVRAVFYLFKIVFCYTFSRLTRDAFGGSQSSANFTSFHQRTRLSTLNINSPLQNVYTLTRVVVSIAFKQGCLLRRISKKLRNCEEEFFIESNSMTRIIRTAKLRNHLTAFDTLRQE